MHAILGRRRWWLIGCVALALALGGLWLPLYYWPAEALRLEYQRIHEDMTAAEVTAILGQADNEPGTIGSWTRPAGKVIVLFAGKNPRRVEYRQYKPQYYPRLIGSIVDWCKDTIHDWYRYVP
jgi:hypothetical protein